MIGPTSSLTDIAFAVCTALDRRGFHAVLTGGSAATYYAPEAYQSGDLDFVITLKGTGGEAALAALGFSRKRGSDFYRHPRSHFILEFPNGPLAVGEDLIKVWSTVRRDDEVLYTSCRPPTHAVTDSRPFSSGTTSAAWNKRLLSFMHGPMR